MSYIQICIYNRIKSLCISINLSCKGPCPVKGHNGRLFSRQQLQSNELVTQYNVTFKTEYICRYISWSILTKKRHTIYCHINFIPDIQISMVYASIQKQYQQYSTIICSSLTCKHLSHVPLHGKWSYKGCVQGAGHFTSMHHWLLEFI